ncbi:HD-domain/PDEase-like protein [Clavulina sp. PMI_390]|nr:HD-domain/PDEase-like protein [Clavulina sp. PMI_390]
MVFCSHPARDPFTSRLLRAEDFYLAQYNATRRRSVDTGGLALALQENRSPFRFANEGQARGDDDQHVSMPYAEMLSRLYMQTTPESCLPDDDSPQSMAPSTRSHLISTAGSWAFDSLSLTEEELFETTCLIFDVLFTIEGATDAYGISSHQLRPFLQAMRSVYSHDNTYHNYQHAVDVLQAMYTFLTDAGCIPPISILEDPTALTTPSWRRRTGQTGTLKDVLDIVDIFMLFIAALGHDAGHPGLNNGFMKSAGTCLSSLFNHSSTLERMHCTLLLQLMRNFGLGHLIRNDDLVFGLPEPLRTSLVETVLATDMSLHFGWIQQFNSMIDQRAANQAEGNDPRRVKLLACQALMKCADISNPVRPPAIGEAWSRALMHEWYAQATLENSMALPTSVPSKVPPPNRPSIFTPLQEPGTSSSHQRHAALYHNQADGWDISEVTAAKEQVKVQVGFVDVFTAPLYTALARFAPELAHFNTRCMQNREVWDAKSTELAGLEEQLEKALPEPAAGLSLDEEPEDTIEFTEPFPSTTQNGTPSRPVTPPLPSARMMSENDTRSSIDSSNPLFSPGMLSDFSFGGGRRASATTVASSFASMDDAESGGSGVELDNTPKPQRTLWTNQFPFSRHTRNLSTVSTFTSTSGASSYYTARSRTQSITSISSKQDLDDPPQPATRTPIPNFIREHARISVDPRRLGRRSPFRVSSLHSPGPAPDSPSPLLRNLELDDRKLRSRVGHSVSSSVDHVYRPPLGVESMQAAYLASARNQAGVYSPIDEPEEEAFGRVGGIRGPSGFGYGEFPYRRRSAGNVGPYVRPLAAAVR